jgi:hypothetical protein
MARKSNAVQQVVEQEPTINMAAVEPVTIVPPVIETKEQPNLDDKGRIREVKMAMVEWLDIVEKNNLKTKYSQIMYLHGMGFSPTAISKHLGILYQHVRNELNRVPKRQS